MKVKVLVIGAGLAGSEASSYLANHGVSVVLAESKGLKLGPAQKMKSFTELVCTNSLKSKDPDSSHGLLKYEMEALGSVVLKQAHIHAVPAGGALAVDKDKFSASVTEYLKNHPDIEVIESDVTDPIQFAKVHGCEYTILATGPLPTKQLEEWLVKNIAGDDLYFYDAIAPVIDAEGLDFDKLYFKDRYSEVTDDELPDYLNAPMNKEEYLAFVTELQKAEKVPAQNFEEYKFFESCLPIDLMAERGVDTPRFSCMKPVGLEKSDGSRPYAVVQLRRENLLGNAYNLVGFQTRLTYKEQIRIFKMIPGLENATFLHLGSVHRNTFLNSRKILNANLSSKEYPRLFFAGQMTGVEGYTESAAMGQYCAFQVLRAINKQDSISFPVETGMGALINYIMTANPLRPSNINFGLLPPVVLSKEQRKMGKLIKKIKKGLASERARKSFDEFWQKYGNS